MGLSIHGDGMAGEPRPWQMGFQDAASPVMQQIADLNVLLSIIVVGITALVLALIAFVVWRFRAHRNPELRTTTHNAPLEVVWTVAPSLVLLLIAVPSFRLLYFQDRASDAEMTLKVTSHQWYWSYEYADQGGLAFDSFMLPDQAVGPDQPRLLAVDKAAVLPVDTTIRVVVTSSDVLHGFAVPALGVKIDTIPGRLNETWIRIDKPGMYYGQCSELCGIGHAFMPIGIKAVSKGEFEAWANGMRAALAGRESRPSPARNTAFTRLGESR